MESFFSHMKKEISWTKEEINRIPEEQRNENNPDWVRLNNKLRNFSFCDEVYKLFWKDIDNS